MFSQSLSACFYWVSDAIQAKQRVKFGLVDFPRTYEQDVLDLHLKPTPPCWDCAVPPTCGSAEICVCWIWKACPMHLNTMIHTVLGEIHQVVALLVAHQQSTESLLQLLVGTCEVTLCVIVSR